MIVFNLDNITIYIYLIGWLLKILDLFISFMIDFHMLIDWL